MWNTLGVILSFGINFIVVYPVINLTHWVLPVSVYQNYYVHEFLFFVYSAVGRMGYPQTDVNADIFMTVLLLMVTGIANGLIFPYVPVLRNINSLMRWEYRPSGEEGEKMEAVKRYIEAKSGEDMSRWNLQVSSKQEYNAYAIGYNRIIIHQPMMTAYSVPELAGIVAHEMGHCLHGDTRATGMIYAFSLVGQVCFFLIWIVARILGFFSFIPILGILLAFTSFIFNIYLIAWNVLMNIPVLFLQFFSRRMEFNADAHALEMNLGQELIWGLEALKVGTKDAGWKVIWMTHPNMSTRIQRLKDKLPEQYRPEFERIFGIETV